MTPSRRPAPTPAARVLTPDDLVAAPELATLAALDAVLHVAVLALVAENADLLLDRPCDRARVNTPRLRAADALVGQIHALQRALIDYRDRLDAAACDRHADATVLPI